MAGLSFIYRGTPVEMWRNSLGYDLRCPQCGRIVLLRTGAGGHALTTTEGKPTVSPSMVHKCGWHVWLREGEAVDA